MQAMLRKTETENALGDQVLLLAPPMLQLVANQPGYQFVLPSPLFIDTLDDTP